MARRRSRLRAPGTRRGRAGSGIGTHSTLPRASGLGGEAPSATAGGSPGRATHGVTRGVPASRRGRNAGRVGGTPCYQLDAGSGRTGGDGSYRSGSQGPAGEPRSTPRAETLRRSCRQARQSCGAAGGTTATRRAGESRAERKRPRRRDGPPWRSRPPPCGSAQSPAGGAGPRCRSRARSGSTRRRRSSAHGSPTAPALLSAARQPPRAPRSRYRRFGGRAFAIDELNASGVLPAPAADRATAALRSGCKLLISGGTGSGRDALQRAGLAVPARGPRHLCATVLTTSSWGKWAAPWPADLPQAFNNRARRLPRHRAREPRRSGALAPGDLRDAGDDALPSAVACRGVVDGSSSMTPRRGATSGATTTRRAARPRKCRGRAEPSRLRPRGDSGERVRPGARYAPRTSDAPVPAAAEARDCSPDRDAVPSPPTRRGRPPRAAT